MKSSSLILCLLLNLVLTCRASADVIFDWNNVLLDTIRTGSMSPLPASRAGAMVHTAMYDAVNSIAQTHEPYHWTSVADPTTSREAAAAQAAHRVLSGMFPANQAKYDTALATSLGGVTDGAAKTAGIALGNSVGDAILALRASDGASAVVSYTPGSDPGDWRPTPPAFAPAAGPQWPMVTPWAMTSGSQFRNPDGPPALDSAEYAAAFNEVKEIGSATSATRSDDQSDAVLFWASVTGTSTPVGHWFRIGQTVAESQGNTLEENARMFALMGITQADSNISQWDNKYTYNHWRPVTAIREADSDGNPATDQDADWLSFLATPNHPSYASGHANLSGSMAALLSDFFGTDNISFTSSAEGANVPDRSFSSFSEAANEAANSRLWGGIHWRYDNEDALAAGTALGHYVHETHLTPEPSSGLLLGLACLTVGLWRRRSAQTKTCRDRPTSGREYIAPTSE